MPATMELVNFSKGDILARQGDDTNRIFVLYQGELTSKLAPEALRKDDEALRSAPVINSWDQSNTILSTDSMLVGHYVESLVAGSDGQALAVPMTQPDLLKQLATQPKTALSFGRSLAHKVMKANSSLTGAQAGVARLGQDLERIYTSYFDLVKGMQKDADGEPDILEALNWAKGTKTYNVGQKYLGDDGGGDGAPGVTRVIESYEMQGKQHKLKRGEALCRQGDPGNSMFVVMSGKLGVVINGTRVGEIGVGEMVGEISVLLGSQSQPRTADLVAEDKTTVGIIPGDQFEKLVTAQPTMLISILARIASRIENNYAVIADREGREKAHVAKYLGPKSGADPEADYRTLAKKIEVLIENYDYPLYREFDVLERGAEKIAGFKEKYAKWLG